MPPVPTVHSDGRGERCFWWPPPPQGPPAGRVGGSGRRRRGARRAAAVRRDRPRPLHSFQKETGARARGGCQIQPRCVCARARVAPPRWLARPAAAPRPASASTPVAQLICVSLVGLGNFRIFEAWDRPNLSKHFYSVPTWLVLKKRRNRRKNKGAESVRGGRGGGRQRRQRRQRRRLARTCRMHVQRAHTAARAPPGRPLSGSRSSLDSRLLSAACTRGVAVPLVAIAPSGRERVPPRRRPRHRLRRCRRRRPMAAGGGIGAPTAQCQHTHRQLPTGRSCHAAAGGRDARGGISARRGGARWRGNGVARLSL